MGFRTGAFATVWSVERVSDTFTKGRISISRKDKNTGEYVQDFGGFVSFLGTACASRALGLKEKDRIKLGDVDVSNRYDKEKQTTYTNFNIFSYEMANDTGAGGNTHAAPQPAVDDGEPDDDRLPF